MISKALIQHIYDAAAMQRWNDHIRPHCGFTELDKQAHKMVYAYLLARVEEHDRNAAIDWQRLIEIGIFEFLQRVRLTDLKPPIYYRLMEEKREELSAWVLDGLGPALEGLQGGFPERMRSFYLEPGPLSLEERIIRASHYLASSWEFSIIRRFNQGLYGIDETSRELEGQVEDYIDLAGVQKIRLGQKTSSFLDMTGQMRFQQRWAHIPRIPETSVLGHMLVVAMLSYLVSLETGACSRRLYNNFFGGLFHDLPEALTRDILSPVKESVEGLDALIKGIEDQMIKEKMLPLLPVQCRSEMLYFIHEEFASRIIQEGKVRHISSDEISARFNDDIYNPIDGELIKACDKLAAFIEAALSMAYGVRPWSLAEARDGIYDKNSATCAAGYDFKPLYDYFMD